VGDVIIRNLDGPFAALPHRFFDGSYAMQEIAVLLYLVNRPDGWKIHHSDIVARFSNGKAAVRTACEALKAKGHLQITAVRGEQGKIMSWCWTVTTDPESDFQTVEPEVQNTSFWDSGTITKSDSTKNDQRPKTSSSSKPAFGHEGRALYGEFVEAIREHLYRGEPPHGHEIGRCLSVVKALKRKGVDDDEILDAIRGVRLVPLNKGHGRELAWLNEGSLTMLVFNRAEQQGVPLLQLAAHEYRKRTVVAVA
jgi:hypothetical protein